MPHRTGFVRGAVLLAGATAVSKLLGSVYTIVLQNVIGDRGMGLYQMAYPIYATLLAVATAGFPVAISKLVSERVAVGDPDGARTVFRIACVLLTLAGAACCAVLFAGADVFARLAGDPASAGAIRAIAPALLVVPVMSALRGYFQGYQWMEPTASSQVAEQLVRVATILGLAIGLVWAGFGVPYAAAGAAFGAVTGALAGMMVLLRYWRRHEPAAARPSRRHGPSRSALSRQLLYIAFPVSLGALVVPLVNNVDVLTVVNLLKAAGVSQDQATADFGLLTGRAFKLMMLPTTLAAGIGIAVMPAVSEAFTLGWRDVAADRMATAIRLTVTLALPASAGLALLAVPLDIALFRDSAGAGAIQAMAFATVFASLQTTLAAVLQGAGWMYLPVVNLLLAALFKLAGNLALIPVLGIAGAAWATVGSYVAASALNLWAVRRRLREPVDWSGWFGRPLLATFIMSAAVYAMVRQAEEWTGFTGRAECAAVCLVVAALGMLVYGMALLAAGSLRREELKAIPKIGPQLVSWCARIGLLR
ncbi:MAG: polysaccharide biosynthesis protein [Alicyclobacillaceae bacterium]|nr:polysaccharide biosynthesis protein [Alicyclobacillaceae bacterium]